MDVLQEKRAWSWFAAWQVKKIFEFLSNGLSEIRSSLDLSFEDDSVADEKIPFLAHLANVLKHLSLFPYEPPAGSRRFRGLIANFLNTYHHIPLTPDVSNCVSFSFTNTTKMFLFTGNLKLNMKSWTWTHIHKITVLFGWLFGSKFIMDCKLLKFSSRCSW